MKEGKKLIVTIGRQYGSGGRMHCAAAYEGSFPSCSDSAGLRLLPWFVFMVSLYHNAA